MTNFNVIPNRRKNIMEQMDMVPEGCAAHVGRRYGFSRAQTHFERVA